jgi:hypothetical protein
MEGFKIIGEASSPERQHPELQSDVVPLDHLTDRKHERNNRRRE